MDIMLIENNVSCISALKRHFSSNSLLKIEILRHFYTISWSTYTKVLKSSCLLDPSPLCQCQLSIGSVVFFSFFIVSLAPVLLSDRVKRILPAMY